MAAISTLILRGHTKRGQRKHQAGSRGAGLPGDQSALADKPGYHVVAVRSTVLPGSVERLLIPLLEQCSGKRAGVDFGVCMNPEFLREGSAIDDFYHPSLVVIGELDERSGDALHALYVSVDAQVTRVPIRVAEMVRYASNAFHAVKVVFANEIGNLSKAHGIDGRQVMEIFLQDRKLNVSGNYLMPGFAFGGSCLPKDLRAILYRSKRAGPGIAVAPLDAREQPAAGRQGRQDGRIRRLQEGGHPGIELQGGHRRRARESCRGSGRNAPRQGLRHLDFRRRTAVVEAGWRKQGSSWNRNCRTSVLCSLPRWTPWCPSPR